MERRTTAEFHSFSAFENENKRAWARNYYGIFSDIINKYNYKNAAEVGIGYGTHAKQILKETTLDKLYLIDPMKFYPNDDFARDVMNTTPTITGNQFDDLYLSINNYLKDYNTRYTWFRKESTHILDDEIMDKSLDCVFIDGNHEYEYVFNDLQFWYKKVRDGGQILGDDYCMSDVCAAVHDFEVVINKKADFLTLPNNSYKIYRFFV